MFSPFRWKALIGMVISLKPAARIRTLCAPADSFTELSPPLSLVTPRRTSSIQTIAFGSVTIVIVRAPAGVAPSGLRNPFQQGFLVGALNPKTAVFFLAFLPQFADPTRGPIPPQLILFGLVFIALACVPDFAWAIGAARMRGHLARVSRRLIDRLAAVVYAILALFVLALQRRAN